ncbi:hypothetical protein [Azotobacter beijerinckii]|uniref:hypothetical protein n=1 Tax=Azotobacter beijerinckii TaxID=170623 RepID=UPI0029548932|nr:hypothetical protein [Azotobacter beijerinckii]MDV7213166.1 hypothetical protein [Azotobacter beijerinckii]
MRFALCRIDTIHKVFHGLAFFLKAPSTGGAGMAISELDLPAGVLARHLADDLADRVAEVSQTVKDADRQDGYIHYNFKTD